MTMYRSRIALLTALLVLGMSAICSAQHTVDGDKPWMNTTLSPDQRAELVLQRMTLDEKIQLVHGSMAHVRGDLLAEQMKLHKDLDQEEVEKLLPGSIPGALGGDGFVPGIPRLGIPSLQISGGGLGVTNKGHRKNGQSTALPSSLAETATWDLNLAQEVGSTLGKETRESGFNLTLGGAINLAREARDGRNFEYHGEDPLLAGEIVGAELKAIQAQGVIADIKHYAVNDQESGRGTVSSNLDERSLRETDLLAFEIAIERSHVGTVMCSYNRLNGAYACENKYLLTDVLKQDWNFQGWVLSDWGATHSTVAAALAGLDQEFFENKYFSAPLKDAISSGFVPLSRLNDMVGRILRTMFAVGVIDNPPRISPVNFQEGAAIAQKEEEQGSVLLKNSNNLLPLDPEQIQSIAVIGSHADLGVLSGGGSAQVEPQGGNAILLEQQTWISPIWDPSPPLLSIIEMASHASVRYDEGKDILASTRAARQADVVIVFVNQYTYESLDLPTLGLADNQDELVRRVAAVNPHVVVVAETGDAFLMPWLNQVGAVLETWYPGARGGQAIANILFGKVNPSGKLPLTFPRSDADLPHPRIIGPPAGSDEAHPILFDVNYTEGLQVGYKWFDAQKKQPLFPFGFGLSYTTFSYSKLHVDSGKEVDVTFEITNTGSRAGAEVAQIYLGLPQGTNEPPLRLVGWQKVNLEPGEHSSVKLTLPPRMMSIFDVKQNAWTIVPGKYLLYVGGSSRDLPLQTSFSVQTAKVIR